MPARNPKLRKLNKSCKGYETSHLKQMAKAVPETEHKSSREENPHVLKVVG